GSLSDQAPAAGGFERIYAGVGPPDRDAAFGHSLARRFEARCCKLRRKAAEVREARNEADEIDDVRRRRRQLDYTLGLHRMEPGDGGQGRGVISDRNLDSARRIKLDFVQSLDVAGNDALNGLMILADRIEDDQNRVIRRMEIASAFDRFRFKQPQQLQNT